MRLVSVLAAGACAVVGGVSLLALADDGFTWSLTPSSDLTVPSFISEDQVFFDIPSSLPESQAYPVYYAYKLTEDELPSSLHVDGSKFPSHGPGWSGVAANAYVVREGLVGPDSGSSLSSAWLCCYFQLGFGTSGYYPVYDVSGAYYAIPVSQFPSMSGEVQGENVGWLYNFGEFIVSNSATFTDVLDFEIFGHKFIYLLATSAIFVYMGWCVVKWAVGL